MADVTHAVNDPLVLDGAPWIRIVPLRTPTLPPATHTNCYIIGDAAGAIVIDPASPYPEEQARLEAILEGTTVTEIVLTHHHVDHVSGATPLATRLGGVAVVAHAETAARLRGRVEVTRTIDDGAQLSAV